MGQHNRPAFAAELLPQVQVVELQFGIVLGQQHQLKLVRQRGEERGVFQQIAGKLTGNSTLAVPEKGSVNVNN